MATPSDTRRNCGVPLVLSTVVLLVAAGATGTGLITYSMLATGIYSNNTDIFQQVLTAEQGTAITKVAKVIVRKGIVIPLVFSNVCWLLLVLYLWRRLLAGNHGDSK